MRILKNHKLPNEPIFQIREDLIPVQSPDGIAFTGTASQTPKTAKRTHFQIREIHRDKN